MKKYFQNVVKIIYPEKEFGKGCDIAIIRNEDFVTMLVECKKCNLSITDASRAVTQIKDSEGKLKEKGLVLCKVKRILLHDGHSCKVYDKAIMMLQSKGIERLPVSSAPPFLRKVFHSYRKRMRDS